MVPVYIFKDVFYLSYKLRARYFCFFSFFAIVMYLIHVAPSLRLSRRGCHRRFRRVVSTGGANARS